MSKAYIVPATAALFGLCGCAPQPIASGPLPLPMTQTASTDWNVPLHPDGTLAQADDEEDAVDEPSLEERARAVFGNKPMRGTLPDNELNQELLFKFLLSEIAAQRGNMQLAAQGYLEMAKSSRDPRPAHLAVRELDERKFKK